jgi:hypothetical protein
MERQPAELVLPQDLGPAIMLLGRERHPGDPGLGQHHLDLVLGHLDPYRIVVADLGVGTGMKTHPAAGLGLGSRQRDGLARQVPARRQR